MTATLTTVDAILKEIYGPRIEEQLQNEVVGLKRIERTSDGVVETAGGKYVDFPIHVRRNHGIGYRNENEQLPAAGQQGYDEVHVPLRYGYGVVRFTGQLMSLAETNKQAFASGMQREMDGLEQDLIKDQNRIFYGDGKGILATAQNTSASTNDVQVDSLRFMELGMIVDLLVIADGTVRAQNREITAIDEGTSTVTLSGAAFAVNASVEALYRYNSRNKEATGLDAIVNTGNVLFGIDPSTEPKWQATVDSNGGTNRSLSEGLMIKNIDEARVKGGKTTLILYSLGVRRAYFNLLSQLRRYPNTQEFEGGFKGLTFHHGREIPCVEDVDMEPNSMYGLEEKRFKVYRNKEWHWAADDGQAIKWVADYDAWTAFMRQYHELGPNSRNAHWKIEDITEG